MAINKVASKPILKKTALCIAILLWLLAPAALSANNGIVSDGVGRFTANDVDPVRTIRASEQGLNFVLSTPPLKASKSGEITVSGLNQTISQPGAPALPYYSTLIAVPPQATIAVHIKADKVSLVHDIDVNSVATPVLDGIPSEGSVIATDTFSEILTTSPSSQDAVAKSEPFPLTYFTLSEPQYWRDVRLVRLDLFPLRYLGEQRELEHTRELSVSVQFSKGSSPSSFRPIPGLMADNHQQLLKGLVLNYEQVAEWRSLPLEENAAPAAIMLPVGVETYKIEVNKDGIYEVTGAELAAAGMNLGAINPATIQMMHAGQSVAYQFIDVDGQNDFDSNDVVRFFGWEFDGTRHEKLYVDNNIYWLWAGGSATTLASAANEAGNGYAQLTSFRDNFTRNDENHFFSGWAIDWNQSPNDPTTFHWDYLQDTTPVGTQHQSPNCLYPPDVTQTTCTYDIALPSPVPGSTDSNDLTVELTTLLNPFAGSLPTYTVETDVNGVSPVSSTNWVGHQNVNLDANFAGDDLLSNANTGYPDNQVNVRFSATGAGRDIVLLTSVSVEYWRQIEAFNDELIFAGDAAGQHEFHIEGFTSGSATDTLVWDITDPYNPININMSSGDIQSNGPTFTYLLGRTHAANGKFIATTKSNIKSALSVTSYVPTSLEPSGGGAAWLAITHPDFLDAANTLATYRQSQMSTFVASIEDVVNQYNYGFNTPQAIHNYALHGLTNWNPALAYVTLFGDATINPRNLGCLTCNPWDENEPTYVVTDQAFVDRWNGMVPSDYSMSLLVGDDLWPEIALARIPANTLTEANDMVNKVILFETDRINNPSAWQDNFLFVADDTDSGGNFCFENQQTGQLLPLTFNQDHLCLANNTVTDTDTLRSDMFSEVNDVGVSVFNYRGHGSLQKWADTSSSPPLMSTLNETAPNSAAFYQSFWINTGKPVVLLSADCLDGYFAFPNRPGLGESMIQMPNSVGSVAHWSSSGFGFSSEHSVLHGGFYDGMFNNDLTRIGDAVNYAKIAYDQAGRFHSELYSFLLLGDAALKVVPSSPTGQEPTDFLHLPAVLRP